MLSPGRSSSSHGTPLSHHASCFAAKLLHVLSLLPCPGCGQGRCLLIMKQNATVKAAYSYLYILGGVTDLSLEKTWVVFF